MRKRGLSELSGFHRLSWPGFDGHLERGHDVLGGERTSSTQNGWSKTRNYLSKIKRGEYIC